MMNLLIEKFPEFLVVNGAECPVNWDFRTVLKCNEIIESAEELTGDSLLKVLLLFYRDCDYFTEGHVDKMFWFFSCGREQSKKKFPRKIAGVNDKQPFDFQEDAGLIYAGFIQQYGIDLRQKKCTGGSLCCFWRILGKIQGCQRSLSTGQWMCRIRISQKRKGSFTGQCRSITVWNRRRL